MSAFGILLLETKRWGGGGVRVERKIMGRMVDIPIGLNEGEEWMGFGWEKEKKRKKAKEIIEKKQS
jgi:hypothetical protein